MAMIVIIVVNIFFPLFVAAVCPDHWTRNEDTCYFHDMSLVTFKEASEKCNAFNATLVSIHSLRQNDWINRFVSEQYTWLGAISTLDKKSNASIENTTNQHDVRKELNGTHVPKVTITVTRVSQSKAELRSWDWIDGSIYNYWIWSKGDWFGMIPKQPDCNASCCTIFMNEVGSWVDEDCNDPRRVASTLCGLRYDAIPSKSSVEYETESKQTISSEVSMIQKMLNYIEGNFITRNALDERSAELDHRSEINKIEVLNQTTGKWAVPFIVILSLIVLLLVISNVFMLYQLRKTHIFSTISLRKFNFKTLNNQVSVEEVRTVNDDL